MSVDKNERIIGQKKIYESYLKLEEGDTICVVSDGAIHAGIGQMLNLGWCWDDVNEYLKDLNEVNRSPQLINGNFIGVCSNLYNNKPGDDTTIMTIKVRRPEVIDLFIGPPADKSLDIKLAEIMKTSNNMKIICGGTTALIAERELGRTLEVDMDTMRDDVPPMAFMEGFDLITEGVLTLGKTLENIKKLNNSSYEHVIKYDDYDGCSLLTQMLMDIGTHINIYIGRAVNPAHQNPNFPMGYNIKQNIIDTLTEELKKAGKHVQIWYL